MSAKGRGAAHTRFPKGQSGNPKGRPRKMPANTSAFDIVIDRTLSVTQSGKTKELSVDEALQQKTFNDAMNGSRLAQRAVLKMIEKREAWFEKRQPRNPVVTRRLEYPDSDNATGALLLLGIARNTNDDNPNRIDRILLEAWAVRAALDRRRPRGITEIEKRSIYASAFGIERSELEELVRP